MLPWLWTKNVIVILLLVFNVSRFPVLLLLSMHCNYFLQFRFIMNITLYSRSTGLLSSVEAKTWRYCRCVVSSTQSWAAQRYKEHLDQAPETTSCPEPTVITTALQVGVGANYKDYDAEISGFNFHGFFVSFWVWVWWWCSFFFLLVVVGKFLGFLDFIREHLLLSDL